MFSYKLNEKQTRILIFNFFKQTIRPAKKLIIYIHVKRVILAMRNVLSSNVGKVGVQSQKLMISLF